MSSYEFKPRLWPTLFSITMVVCLVLLGNWQFERLDWKLGLIEKLETLASMAPVSLPIGTVDMDELEYMSVSVTGSFNNDQEMTLYSIGPNGGPGYDLFTPFTVNDGSVVIINRGWVHEKIKSQSARPVSLTMGEVTIAGLLRKPWGKLWYGPENEPDNNNWYYGDINGMARTQNLQNVFPMFLYAAVKGGDKDFPIAGRTNFNIVNNHLDYALTWFGLAIVLVGIYFIAHIKKK